MQIPFSRYWPILGAALLAGVLSLLVLFRGININPDGWAFWEGAVSMQEGYGFTHFYHRLPVLMWPPLYSVYLMLWQSAAGISGRTLIAANIALSMLAAGSWLLLLHRTIPSSFSPRTRRTLLVLCLVFFSAFFAYNIKSVLSENLRFALLAWYVLAVFETSRATTFAYGRTVLLFTAGSLLLLTHHSTLAFLLAGSVILLTARRADRIRLASRDLLAGLIFPVAIWVGVRSMLGQMSSHPLYPELDVSFLLANLGNIGDAAAMLFVGPLPGVWSRIAAGAIIALLLFLFNISRATRTDDRKNASILLHMAVLSTLFLLAICQATRIPVLTRFIWYLPLLLTPWLLILGFSRSKPVRILLTSVLIFPAVVKILLLIGATVTDHHGYVSSKPDDRFIRANMYIDPDHPVGAPAVTDRGIRVSPPVFDWIERRGGERGVREGGQGGR